MLIHVSVSHMWTCVFYYGHYIPYVVRQMWPCSAAVERGFTVLDENSWLFALNICCSSKMDQTISEFCWCRSLFARWLQTQPNPTNAHKKRTQTQNKKKCLVNCSKQQQYAAIIQWFYIRFQSTWFAFSFRCVSSVNSIEIMDPTHKKKHVAYWSAHCMCKNTRKHLSEALQK